jgi:protein-disulfide isomerase
MRRTTAWLLAAALVGVACGGPRAEPDPTFDKALPGPADVDDSLSAAIPGDRRPATYEAGVDGVRGAAVPLVTIVEFSDFQCPFCGQAAQVLGEAAAAYPEDVRIVFKQFPLPMHPDAKQGAAAVVAAGKQGHFWAMHDRLFANRTAMKPEDLQAHAKELGLDAERFAADLASPDVAAQVEADGRLGRALGVRGTPSLFINGLMVGGAPKPDMLVQLIERERAVAAKLLEAGSTREEIYARMMRKAGAASAPR